MTPVLLYDPIFLEHDTGAHPENAGRVRTVLRRLESEGLWDRLPRPDFAPAEFEDVEAVHDPAYLSLLREYAGRGGGRLTADTPFSARSWDAALAASGATVAAVESVLNGSAPSAFALTRPPGHHACPAEGMGFCLINHAAVAARRAVRKHGLEDAGFLLAYQEILVPIARRYRPELILVSAGYDAHWSNTAYLNSIRMGATVTAFAQWTALLRDLAAELCGGKIAFMLEGGYDPEALGWSVAATLRVLLGEEAPDPLGPPPRAATPDVRPLIESLRRGHGLGE
jgi:acetoin utilization deacetylase AcuC-like enzyme